MTRKAELATATPAKTSVNINRLLQRRSIPGGPTTTSEVDERKAIVRGSLRELVEQAASYSGAADEKLMSERITEQEMKLALLKKQREALA